MTLEQLKTFLRVAKLGGIRKAALEMNLSQPALSARISSLEEELGVSLFNRGKQGMALTPEGVRLRAHAERIESYITQIRADLTPSQEVKGTLRLGVAETIARSWLSDFLREIRQHYPKLELELSVDVTLNLREQLLSHHIDLAILMGPLSEGNVDNIVLPPYPLAWFANPKQENIDLNHTPIITFPRLSRPYQQLVAELMYRYGQVGQLFSSSTLSTSLEMISAGIGVGALPERLAQPLVNEGKLKRFDPGWSLPELTFVAAHLNDPPNVVMNDIAQLALEVAKEWENKGYECV